MRLHTVEYLDDISREMGLHKALLMRKVDPYLSLPENPQPVPVGGLSRRLFHCLSLNSLSFYYPYR